MLEGDLNRLLIGGDASKVTSPSFWFLLHLLDDPLL